MNGRIELEFEGLGTVGSFKALLRNVFYMHVHEES